MPVVARRLQPRTDRVEKRDALLRAAIDTFAARGYFGKKASQLTSPEGKTRLADEIIREVEAPLPQGKHKAKKKVKADADEPKSGKAVKKKAKAQPEGEDDRNAHQRVHAVYFTHFIIQ